MQTDIHRRTRPPLFPVYHIEKNVFWLRHFVSYTTILTCKERRNFYTPSRRLVQSSIFEYLASVGGCMETLAWLIKRNYTNEMLQQKKVSGLKFAWHSIRQGVLRHSDHLKAMYLKPTSFTLHFGGNACTVYCYHMINYLRRSVTAHNTVSRTKLVAINQIFRPRQPVQKSRFIQI